MTERLVKRVGVLVVGVAAVWAVAATPACAADDALSHVMDSKEWHFFTTFEPKHIPLPAPFGFQITKFMVLQLIAAGLIMVIFIPLCR